MNTLDTLKQLARIDDMLALREQAQRARDPESLIVVRMMDHAVADTRRRIRNAIPNARFDELRRQHPVLVSG